MGTWKRGELEYLMGLEHALRLVQGAKNGAQGIEILKNEVKARTGGMSLPAGIDRCTVTELARAQIKPELEVLSVALAWALEKGLKLPPSRMASFLDSYNNRIDLYRYDKEALETDKRILDQSWGGADLAGKYYLEMYEERMNALLREENEHADKD